MFYRSKNLLIALPLALSTTVFADYQIEADVSINKDNAEPSTFELVADGFYYLQSVKSDSSKPMAELDFFQKASRVGGGLSLTSIDETGADDGVSVRGNAHYVVPGNDLILKADIQIGKSDEYEFGAGTYLDQESTVIGSLNIDSDSDVNTFSADYKKVSKFSGQNFIGLNGIVSLIDGDGFSGVNFGAEADYYIDNQTSIGAGLTLATGDLSGVTLSIGAEKFLDEKIALFGGIRHIDLSADNVSGDSYQEIEVGIKARF